VENAVYTMKIQEDVLLNKNESPGWTRKGPERRPSLIKDIAGKRYWVVALCQEKHPF
jgi:hypothetical protein